MKIENIISLVDSLINGNWSYVKPRFKRLSWEDKTEFLHILASAKGSKQAEHDVNILMRGERWKRLRRLSIS